VTSPPAPTAASTIAEALSLMARAERMDAQSSGNRGSTPRLMMERAKTLAFVSVAQTVGEMAANAASASAEDRPGAERLLAALLVLQSAVTPPIDLPAAPAVTPPAVTAPTATAPAVVVPTAPTGVLLTTYAAAWGAGYTAAHPASWAAGYAAAWQAAHAAGYGAGHTAGHAVGVRAEAAVLLRLLTSALTA
jgi:hypothetical protein